MVACKLAVYKHFSSTILSTLLLRVFISFVAAGLDTLYQTICQVRRFTMPTLCRTKPGWKDHALQFCSLAAKWIVNYGLRAEGTGFESRCGPNNCILLVVRSL